MKYGPSSLMLIGRLFAFVLEVYEVSSVEIEDLSMSCAKPANLFVHCAWDVRVLNLLIIVGMNPELVSACGVEAVVPRFLNMNCMSMSSLADLVIAFSEARCVVVVNGCSSRTDEPE